jgi:hypothetical protein
VLDRIERFKHDFNRRLRPIPASVEQVEETQDTIKAALEGLEK